MDFDSLSKLMRECGIVGCGGAGFPSYAKLNKSVDTLIVNCTECEPLLRLHRQLVERKTAQILEAIKEVSEALEVKNVYLALKKCYTKTIESLNQNLPNFPGIKLALLNEVYPAGDEVMLINEVTKRIVPPGSIPSSVGVVVYNVETMYNVYRGMNGKKVTHKYVTVTGEVNEPRTYYAPIGSKIYGLVKRAGGAKIEDPEFLIGGPMMGRLGNDQDVITKTTNAIILLPKDHPVVQRKRITPSTDLKRAMAACSQCHYCTDLCPRHLIGHPIDPAAVMRGASNQDSHNITPYLNSFFCSGCGVCEMFACHQGLSPKNLIQALKSELRNAGVRAPVVTNECVPVQDMNLRRVPLARLRRRLNLEQYNHPAPIYLEPMNAKEVVIKTNQHIGAPAIPIVKVNDYVKEGDLIAKAVEDKLSTNYHASIDGTIVEVNPNYITIRK